ncbi:MAG TPA: nucleotidyl transferase [Holosporales bacterium]|nr:nucleotidyl transferase [Holosporales bacterium]
MRAIILAAGRGSRMGSLTSEQPKCLTEVHGKLLIQHQIDALTAAGINDIAIVTGYKSECLKDYGTHHFHNPKWSETNMVYSLFCAKEWLDENDCIVSYSDIFYGPQIVKDLMECQDNIAIAYDPNWIELWSKRFDDPLDDAETFRIDANSYLLEIGQKPKTVEEIEGQYMGLLRLTSDFCRIVNELRCSNFPVISMTKLLSLFIKDSKKIYGVPHKGSWGECDIISDIDLYKTYQ